MTAEDRMQTALDKIIKMLIAAIIVLAVIIGLVVAALAQEHRHPPEHSAIHEKFYKGWARPDNRAYSCCSLEDCAPAQSKMVDGKWFSRFSDNEEWIEIPPQKIETERDSPDGQSHLCKRTSMGLHSVYCFLPASGM